MWIQHVPYDSADGRLKTLYDRIKGPDNNVDNIMMAHSLRPHTMEGHMALYKNVLHHSGNELPVWFLETLGVAVSLINECAYCVEHHFAGLSRVMNDEALALEFRTRLEQRDYNAGCFDGRMRAALRYSNFLTQSIDNQERIHAEVNAMRAAGLTDGCILEVNQVVAYFNYANRTVIGLGIDADGDVLGLSPANAEQPDDWGHR